MEVGCGASEEVEVASVEVGSAVELVTSADEVAAGSSEVDKGRSEEVEVALGMALDSVEEGVGIAIPLSPMILLVASTEVLSAEGLASEETEVGAGAAVEVVADAEVAEAAALSDRVMVTLTVWKAVVYSVYTPSSFSATLGAGVIEAEVAEETVDEATSEVDAASEVVDVASAVEVEEETTSVEEGNST